MFGIMSKSKSLKDKILNLVESKIRKQVVEHKIYNDVWDRVKIVKVNQVYIQVVNEV